jgi:hypothetical protein
MEAIIHSHPYSDDHGFGFSIEERKGNKLCCIYSEIVQVTEDISDPNGNIIHQEFFHFNYIEFNIEHVYGEIYILYILNPSRTYRGFVSRLSLIFDFGVSLSSFDIDLKLLMDLLIDKFNPSSLTVSKIKASGLVLNENSKAIMEVSSKKNALDDAFSVFKSKAFTLDRMTFCFYLDGVKSCFDISKKGTLISSEYGVDLIVSLYKDKEIII